MKINIKFSVFHTQSPFNHAISVQYLLNNNKIRIQTNIVLLSRSSFSSIFLPMTCLVLFLAIRENSILLTPFFFPFFPMPFIHFSSTKHCKKHCKNYRPKYKHQNESPKHITSLSCLLNYFAINIH